MGRLFSIPSFRFSLLPEIGKYSRVATYGKKVKDGTELEFSEQTLGEMLENWKSRGDKLAMCLDHESSYPGKRAPAAAYFDSLALFKDGALVKFASMNDSATPPNAVDGKSGNRDGLYARLSEITPLGADPKEGLANYASISPFFTEAGAKEDGTQIGYDLFDIAATNNPFQSGCAIEFHKLGGPRPSLTKRKIMDEEMRKSLGLADDASDAEAMAALKARFKKYADDEAAMKKKFEDADAAMKKMSDGDGDDDDKKFDDSEVMADDSDGAGAMQKMAKALGFSGKTTPAKMAAAFGAKFVPMSDHANLKTRLDKLEQDRADEKKATDDQKFAALADKAIDAGYDKTKRDSLIAFARSDFKEASAFVESLPKTVALGRVTRGGRPIGKPEDAPMLEEGIDPNEIGADLAMKARKYAKDNNVSLQKAYVKLGKLDDSYARSLDRLRRQNTGE